MNGSGTEGICMDCEHEVKGVDEIRRLSRMAFDDYKKEQHWKKMIYRMENFFK